MNLLRIPHMCQEYESVKKEFNEAIKQNETLILPLATIIESGNHISHIADGNIDSFVKHVFFRNQNHDIIVLKNYI